MRIVENQGIKHRLIPKTWRAGATIKDISLTKYYKVDKDLSNGLELLIERRFVKQPLS